MSADFLWTPEFRRPRRSDFGGVIPKSARRRIVTASVVDLNRKYQTCEKRRFIPRSITEPVAPPRELASVPRLSALLHHAADSARKVRVSGSIHYDVTHSELAKLRLTPRFKVDGQSQASYFAILTCGHWHSAGDRQQRERTASEELCEKPTRRQHCPPSRALRVMNGQLNAASSPMFRIVQCQHCGKSTRN
jgi:hypothetical protein